MTTTAGSQYVSDLTEDELILLSEDYVSIYADLDSLDPRERSDMREKCAADPDFIIEMFEVIGRLKRALYPSRAERHYVRACYNAWFDGGVHNNRSIWQMYQIALAQTRTAADE